MRVITTVQEMVDERSRWAGSTKIGFVPTMGYLHEGHLTLVRQGRKENDKLLASIFVNPTQFGQHEDLGKYPRDLPHDLRMLETLGVDVAFVPTTEEVYPPGFVTYVDPTGPLTEDAEGKSRPGHFRGVATVVLKLFQIVRPDQAYFGQKDAQQAEVIRRMIRDLALEIELRVLPTVRDADGLALSSRNARLSPDERERALALPRALKTKDAAEALAALAASNGLAVDYVELADFDPPVLAGAVRVGETRLIDNVVLEGEDT